MPFALIAQIIAALPTITTGVSHLIAWLSEVRNATKQTGEWTPELEAKFMDALIDRATSPAYQPDSVIASKLIK